ncbi:MAG: redoxin domain-containing protein [Roseibium album]|uniref:redoxin domain-containing protein n=1 Tax=Roseibium album TaxID=311410 RepID=UPI0032EBB24F
MTNNKPHVGETFPKITVPQLGGGNLELGKPDTGHDWRLVVVYRGKHCPICTRYLKELGEIAPDLAKIGIDVVAVSADPEDRAREQIAEAGVSFPVGFNLDIPQMRELGLYVSNPRSAQETDRPFSEPGLFVVNDEGKLQVTDISNAPFARPALSSVLMGLNFIKNPDNNYPVRGTHNDRS